MGRLVKLFGKLFRLGAAPLSNVPGLESHVNELKADFNRINAELAKILDQLAGQPWELRVDKIIVDKVTLDQIVFNLDGLDVKDLSGSLSIGLNYGGRVVRMEPSQKPVKPEPASDNSQNGKAPPGRGQPRVNVSFQNPG